MIKTINLSANVEQAVQLTGGVHARFENLGDGTVYVSKTANVTEGGDGVIAVPSNATKYMKNVATYGEYDGEYGYQGTVYVKADTSCKVEIETGDYFFKSVNSGKGGAVSGKFVKIKGRVGTVDDLPLIADEGDLYFVGAESDEDSDEYVYTVDGKWELIGNTEVDLSGYVKTSDMADVYGIEDNTVPTIESKINENAVTLGYSGKNLLKHTATTTTTNGVTFTVNSDGSITATGTAVGNAYIKIAELIDTKYIGCILSGCPTGGGVDARTYSLFASVSSYVRYDLGDGIVLTDWKGQGNTANVVVMIYNGYDCGNGVTFKPMIRPASITDDTYEPYKPSVDERLNDVEPSIVDFANILKNYIKTYPVVARATFTRLEGGGADGTSTTRIRTENIPVKKNDVVTIINGSLVHAVGIWKGNIGINTNIRDDSTWQNDETFTISDDGYICVAFAHQNTSQELILSQFDGQVKIVNLLA